MVLNRTKKIFFFYLLFFVSLFIDIFSAAPQADWTTLIFIQAKNNLNRFAAKNLHDMALVGSNKKLNILVQWYQPGKNGIWRYKVSKNKLELISHSTIHSTGDNVADLVDSMKWAVNNYPAKNYFLTLWNHGIGILDPIWGTRRRRGLGYREYSLEQNPRTQIEGIVLDDYNPYATRGILFNEETRNYLTNGGLTEALKIIKTDILKNKKIDVLGMDACSMAMIEVGYQAKDYANYLVASQEVELAYGWNYSGIMNSLSNGNMTPSQLAQSIVLIYEKFYKGRINFYTQSAINLNNMIYLKDSINTIVRLVNECKKHDAVNIKNILNQARRKSQQFSTRSYIDLHSFYSQLFNEFQIHYRNRNRFSNVLLQSVEKVKKELMNGCKIIENSVLAVTAGQNFSTAKGISIYFPTRKVDDSYYKTDFAKETLWLDLVKSSLN